VNTPLDSMKTLQTQISREIHEKIDQMAKSQMVSRAAIVRQLLVKSVAKAKSKSEEMPA
jgi:predicted transcriptional regulator